VLLGAGSSVDAGVPASFEMTGQIQASLNARAPFGLLTEVFNYVCGRLLVHDTARGPTVKGGIDIERVVQALEELGRRSDMPIAPFVNGWQPDLEALEHRKPARMWLRKKLSAKWRKEPIGTIDLSTRGINDLWDQMFPWLRGGGLFEQLASLIVDEMCKQLTTDADDVLYLEPLVKLGMARNGITVASLNYDLSIEQASETVGTTAYTGLKSWVRELDWCWPNDGIRLLKLHGSIDWYWKSPTNPVSPIRIAMADKECENPGLFRPALLFGHGSKLRVEGPFLSLLAEFERMLAAAETLVVVGYSFRDTHINHSIARWLAGNDLRRIVVIDPEFPDLKRSRLDLLRNPQTFREELFYGLAASKKSARARLRLVREPAHLGLLTVLS
jgi:hypothetical protein